MRLHFAHGIPQANQQDHKQLTNLRPIDKDIKSNREQTDRQIKNKTDQR